MLSKRSSVAFEMNGSGKGNDAERWYPANEAAYPAQSDALHHAGPAGRSASDERVAPENLREAHLGAADEEASRPQTELQVDPARGIDVSQVKKNIDGGSDGHFGHEGSLSAVSDKTLAQFATEPESIRERATGTSADLLAGPGTATPEHGRGQDATVTPHADRQGSPIGPEAAGNHSEQAASVALADLLGRMSQELEAACDCLTDLQSATDFLAGKWEGEDGDRFSLQQLDFVSQLVDDLARVAQELSQSVSGVTIREETVTQAVKLVSLRQRLLGREGASAHSGTVDLF